MSEAIQLLERRLRPLKKIAPLPPPRRGWIHAVRQALGMTTTQLARRLRVSQPRVVELEKAELRGSVTLANLARAAEALNCTLVYAFVPRESLDTIVHQRALQIADAMLSRVGHTMGLENQSVPNTNTVLKREQLAKDILTENRRLLWDQP